MNAIDANRQAEIGVPGVHDDIIKVTVPTIHQFCKKNKIMGAIEALEEAEIDLDDLLDTVQWPDKEIELPSPFACAAGTLKQTCCALQAPCN